MSSSWQNTLSTTLLVSFGYMLGAGTIRLMQSQGPPTLDLSVVPTTWDNAGVRQPSALLAPAPAPAALATTSPPPPLRQVERIFAGIATEARERLAYGAQPGAWSEGSVFSAVTISMPLSPPLIKRCADNDGGGQADKNIVGEKWLPKLGNCVVYGMGIADDSGFEEGMARLGCETHAFDCTVDATSQVVAGKSFKFHQWCIGRDDATRKKEVADTNYGHGRAQDSLVFKPLNVTMKELGHSRVDLLKFDIEGFEWELIDSQIVGNPDAPDQLSFELHTEKANPAYVPHHNVMGKGFREVNELFLKLFDMGYRVVSKEINSGDRACAEFVVARR